MYWNLKCIANDRVFPCFKYRFDVLEKLPTFGKSLGKIFYHFNFRGNFLYVKIFIRIARMIPLVGIPGLLRF